MSKNYILIVAVLIFGIISSIFFSGIFVIPLLFLPIWVLLKTTKDLEKMLGEIIMYAIFFFVISKILSFGIAVILLYIFAFRSLILQK